MFEHICQVVEVCQDFDLVLREVDYQDGVILIYSFVFFYQDMLFLIIGERINVNGFKKFREVMFEVDWDMMVNMVKDQVKEGVHVIDVCVDYVGRDGIGDMDEIVGWFVIQFSVLLVFDFIELEVMEVGLYWMGGWVILNLVNFEDGEVEGFCFD